ncbi:triphosphoribosyl-dephospho-CoA protein [Halosimplex carlsbadense 2-9-1]|uniref:Triphosphoribosyl-dephospho-CoA protein n=1 Tax=Halosimplex carlsbadense 2-9-1 TaxID=797114 RepID=M0CUS7_9EURY|nr:triphosphoribosyl-dephospho-CoA synthase [Halosimplex carlsbadense]ELZ25639.1 triphosphoribosyl-dephospho-CoA protein [Halosimplex carlsbadense 2-9-1]
MRTTAQNAELALLLEVAGTPKPGNVDRHRDHDDLRFEHFLTGAVGAQEGLRMAAAGEPVGESFHRAIEGMADQRGGNTQFGAILLQLPLVVAAGADDRHLSPEGATAVVESTTVADAAGFYRAFEAVDVAVDDPPEDMAALDVRRGSDAVPALEERGLTLADIMARSADRDGIAREWVDGFERTFGAAESIESGEGPVADRAADAFLDLLAAEVDTFVVTQHDRATAERATERARAALDGDIDPEDLAAEFVAEEINPGTTADTVAAALFVALERGLEV